MKDSSSLLLYPLGANHRTGPTMKMILVIITVAAINVYCLLCLGHVLGRLSS